MKNMKKLISLLLVAAMVMAMGLSAFAAENLKTQDTTLTINTVAGHTYKVYQMLKGDVSGIAPNSIDKTTEGKGTLANIEKGTNNSAESADAFIAALKNDDGTYLSAGELSIAAGAYVTGTPVASVDGAADDADTADVNESVKAVTVTNGYYIVEDTWTGDPIKDADGNVKSLSRYMVAVVGATTITPKTEDTPVIDKDIVDEDANKALADTDKKVDTAAIGDVIEYEVTGEVPVMTGYTYYYYVVKDTMSEGLTLRDENWVNKDVEGYTDVAKDGFIVTIGTKTLARNTDYTVKKSEDGQSFELAIKDLTQYAAGQSISIKYFATVNDKAKIGLIPNTNTAKLEYSNNPSHTTKHDTDTPDDWFPDRNQPTGVTPEITTKTYVTELTIVKVDENNAILDGATFTLTGENLTKVLLTTKTEFKEATDGTYYKLKDSTYTQTVPHGVIYEYEEDGKTIKVVNGEQVVKEESNESYYDATTKVDGVWKKYALVTTLEETSVDVDTANTVTAKLDNGAFTITGLNAGEYTLTETVTPTGYNTIAPITFTIEGEMKTTDGVTSFAWKTAGADVKLDSAKGVYEATIQNVKGTLLPSTGGIGTTIFYVLGTILVVGAGVVLVAKKRVA